MTPPEAPSASLQAAQGLRPCSSAGTNGMPFVSGLSPPGGAASGPAEPDPRQPLDLAGFIRPACRIVGVES